MTTPADQPAARAGAGRPSLPALAGLIALAVVPYLNALPNPFTWDDHALIVDHDVVHDLANLPRLLASLGGPGYYAVAHEVFARPLTTASHMLDWALWNGSPVGYHATNIALHAAATVAFALAVGAIAGRRRAWLAAALFAVHPIHTEDVTWISGRADVLPAIAVFLAFWLVVRARAVDRWWPRVPLAAVLYALGLLAKEMAFTLPAVLLLWEWGAAPAPRRSRAAALLRWHAPLWAIAAAYLPWRFLLLGQPPWEATRLGDTMVQSLLSSAVIVVQYLYWLVWPLPLSLYHNVPLVRHAGEPAFLGALALLAALTAGAWTLRRREPLLLGAWIAFWLLLGPVLNVVPLYMPLSERYLYIPSAAFCLAAGVAVDGAVTAAASDPRRRRIAWGLVAALLAVLGVRTAARNLDYRTDYRLFGSAVRIGNRQWEAHWNFGIQAQRAGEGDLAVESFRRSVELGAKVVEPWRLLADALREQGRLGEALRAIDRAVARFPNAWRAHLDRGIILRARGQAREAVAAFERAVELQPTAAMPRLGMVDAYLALDDPAAARRVCAEASVVVPGPGFDELHRECERLSGGDASPPTAKDAVP